MSNLPLKLEKRLQIRKDDDSFRSLQTSAGVVDFFSNDYLGLARSEEIHQRTLSLLEDKKLINGSTGSRLLSGNHDLFQSAEKLIAKFHNSESALIFNSGFDANIGLFSSVPQKGDIILYDEFSHASIRDGIRMSLAKSYKFEHNDLDDLSQKLEKFSGKPESDIYVVTESVFSMDGDSPDLEELVKLTDNFPFYLIVDEAHATGVFGAKAAGLLQQLSLVDKVFARIHTFGKGLGCHGAAILGSKELRDYLINFSRSFIYTTALSPHSVAGIIAAYEHLESGKAEVEKLKKNIQYFQNEILKRGLAKNFVKSDSAIQSCLISGNSRVKKIASEFNKKGFDLKAILSPTVPEGGERLRFCIHSYNSEAEISEVLDLLANFVSKS